MKRNENEAFHRPVGCEEMVSTFFKISRSISERANCARNCLFSCARTSLPAGQAAFARAMRTQRPNRTPLIPRLRDPRRRLPVLNHAADHFDTESRIIHTWFTAV